MKKVLVIDDTKNIRMLLSTCLELRGYSVITADNGIEALKIIKNTEEVVDLIFLDVRMPEISGTEVLKVIKEEREDCSVVIMTAFATVKNAIECTKLGALVYLQKPFSPDRINLVLDEIERKEKSKELHKPSMDIVEKARGLLKDSNNALEAHELLKKAIGRDPYNKDIYLLISKVNKILGNIEEAIRFEKIYEMF
ncbi:response regulator [Clostridium nigeriense]|uniref:tetratricopeptide repeat protein n=1 Tax=Clostridium nigeriense TaxID=1805470 RepID=UPI003D3306CB